MIRKAILLFILLLSFPAAGKDLQAQTAEECERRGLSHFKKAYYDAVPKKNTTLGEIEYGLAEKAFRQAIQKRADRIEAYLYLGRTYFVQKKYAQAAKTYRAALKVDPQKKQVYLKMASAQEMGGDYAGAIDSLMRLRDQETDERVLQYLAMGRLWGSRRIGRERNCFYQIRVAKIPICRTHSHFWSSPL